MAELDNMEQGGQALEAHTEPMLSADSEMVEIDLPEDVQKVLFFALDEACDELETGEGLSPFTLVLAGDDVFQDEHAADEVEESYASARASVNIIAHIASAYVFCYDGYIETDEGDADMIIAEVGLKGEPEGFAYGLVYRIDDEQGIIEYDEGLISLGETENLFDAEQAADEAFIEEAYAGLDDEDKE